MTRPSRLPESPLTELALAILLLVGTFLNTYYPQAIRFLFRFSPVFHRYSKEPIPSLETRRTSNVIALFFALVFLAIFVRRYFFLHIPLWGKP